MIDERRFERLWVEHSDSVWSFAARRVGPDLADDIVAETFLVAWRRLQQCSGRPWLLAVARNIIGTTCRTDQRRGRLVERIRNLPQPVRSESSIAQREIIVAALSRLDDDLLEAVLLVGLDHLSPRDAAAVAGCGRSTFRMRLLRGRRELRRQMSILDPSLSKHKR